MLPSDESSAGLDKEGLRKRARVAGSGGESASASDYPVEEAAAAFRDPRLGCPVGAVVCEVARLQSVFAALRGLGWARSKAVRDYEGRKAVHLTIEGAASLSAGEGPEELTKLLKEGSAEFVEGLRLGKQPYMGPAAQAPLKAEAASFTFVELFAGVGGFRHGLEPLGGQCVFASEIDVDCQEAYAANFGSNELFGDITMIPSEDMPRHDLLTAGFPCQPFSRRGERRGFEDARGELFFEILDQTGPTRQSHARHSIADQVFLDGGHWDADPTKCRNGEVYTRVLRCLEEVGYTVQTAQLNSEGWVPQKRARLYFDVLEPEGSPEVIRSELTESQWTAVQKSSTWARGGESLRFAKLDGAVGTLTASYKSSYACTAELLAPVDANLSRPRFFTRREFARLMGFPEHHVFANPHSENRAYHQLGNAVCPPVITAIARGLLQALGVCHSLPDNSAVEQNSPAAPGEYYQQVVTEIAKQLPGVDASLERGYTGPMLPPVAPPPVVPPVVPPVAASPVAPLAPPKNLDGAAPGSSRSREWSPRDPRAEERMEELHRYIRNQANDFAEGKAEWSRQLAEVRSESLREVEKVRREKAELECQARRELARLKHRIKELGGGEEGFSLRALPSDPSEQLAPWAAMVGFEEHQQVQKRCAAAEDRIQELEQYIKASRQESESMESSKEEVPKLRQTVHMLQQELQQAAAELQALRVHHQQKVSFWEQGARRLLGFADQFFSLNGCAPFGSGNEATSGQTRFEKTATKVLVTMPSTDQDGNDDVLKNPPKEAAKKAAKEKTGSEGEGEPEEAGNAEDPAPRDEEVHSYGGASCKVIRPPNGKQGDSASDEVPELAETAKIAHFVAQFAVDLKHLLTASNQVLAPPQASLPVASALAGPKALNAVGR
eukprot:s1972_g7.t1